jgi:hypothetical protein
MLLWNRIAVPKKIVGNAQDHCQRNAEVYKFKAETVFYLGTTVLEMIRQFTNIETPCIQLDATK